METAREEKHSADYSFTITLKPRIFRLNAEDQYDECYKHVLLRLKQITTKCTLVAELTKNCNIHFHGICAFQRYATYNYIKRFHDHFRCRCKNKFTCKCMIGFVNIKLTMNYPGWVDYISKSLKETYDSLSRRPIIIDDYNIAPGGVFEMYGIKME